MTWKNIWIVILNKLRGNALTDSNRIYRAWYNPAANWWEIVDKEGNTIPHLTVTSVNDNFDEDTTASFTCRVNIVKENPHGLPIYE